MKKHPQQPLEIDKNGVIRFKSNKIMEVLLDHNIFDLNEIAILCVIHDIPNNEQEQFAQLIGYSISGYEELSYVSDRSYFKAKKEANLLIKKLEKKKNEKSNKTSTRKS